MSDIKFESSHSLHLASLLSEWAKGKPAFEGGAYNGRAVHLWTNRDACWNAMNDSSAFDLSHKFDPRILDLDLVASVSMVDFDLNCDRVHVLFTDFWLTSDFVVVFECAPPESGQPRKALRVVNVIPSVRNGDTSYVVGEQGYCLRRYGMRSVWVRVVRLWLSPECPV
jgi:hypothetical protein